MPQMTSWIAGLLDFSKLPACLDLASLDKMIDSEIFRIGEFFPDNFPEIKEKLGIQAGFPFQ